MNEVRIAELKANLSAYLSDVRKGAVFVVCDRSTPIAQLTPIRQADDGDLIIDEAVDPPAAARKIKPVKRLRNIDVDRVLAEMREDRH